MRLAFRPVGQTELQRWLADLTSKDGVPPLTREAPPEPVPTTVGPLRTGRRSGIGPGVEPRRRRRDPLEGSAARRHRPPSATEVMTQPAAVRRTGPPLDGPARASGSVGGGILIVGLLVLSVRAMRGTEIRAERGHAHGRSDAGDAPGCDRRRRRRSHRPRRPPRAPEPPPPAAAAPAVRGPPPLRRGRTARTRSRPGRAGEGRRRATRRAPGADKPAATRPPRRTARARREPRDDRSRARRRSGRSSRSSSRPIRTARASRPANAFSAPRR